MIDDDAKERRWLAGTLSAAGYAVETAPTGAAAVARAREQPFAAITLDLLLPDISARDVLTAIRAGGPNRHTPVIVVSVVAEKGVATGFRVHDLLAKPVQSPDLLASLERAGVHPGGAGTS